MDNSNSKQERRPKGHIGAMATNFLHLRNPYTIAWWSAAFPGFGYISLGSYVIGFLLFFWEVLINTKAGVNTAILYSFIGEFAKAKEVLNTKWLLLYAPVYFFSIWGSYRLAVSLNELSILADRRNAVVQPINISTIEINSLNNRIPWVSVAWTLLVPGLGHLYTHRIPTAFFLLVWWVGICYFSNFFPAAHASVLGDFTSAKTTLDMQWLIYLPSIYGFAAYDVYANTVEYNRLFAKEQARFLEKEYQANEFEMPV